ncbi:MAG: 2-C-methyl-D-erythritol 4-phosphate cytidylyltransferase [Phycisphaeraceae bacterium]
MNEHAMRVAVILPAAGRSRRFGGQAKLEVELAGRAVLLRAVDLFAKRPEVSEVIIAADPDGLDAFKLRWGDQLGFLGVKVVAGGRAERWETVQKAIDAVSDEATHIAVHDAARPVADAQMIKRVFAAAGKFDAVIPAVPVTATVKRLGEKAEVPAESADPLDAILGEAGKEEIEAWQVMQTVPREGLWMVQTPQVFKADLLRRAYQQVSDGTLATDQITDDAGLVEAMGQKVVAVMGDPMNVKITVPEDVPFAEAVLRVHRAGAAGGEDALGGKRKFPTWAESDED